MAQREANLQVQVADYLRLRYPNVLFHSDYGSGVKLTMRQAIVQKRQNGGRRAWPDLFIAEPKHKWSEDRDNLGIFIGFAGDGETQLYSMVFGGLMIELKREGTRLKKKNGEWASDHIAEQAEVLEELRKRGYKAEFACGFDEAKKLIDDYFYDGKEQKCQK